MGAAVFILTLVLFYLNVFKPLEWKSWDLRLKMFSDPSQASKDIVLFLIDQESLDIYEKEQGLSWPWPRQIYSAVIRYCMQGGAKAVFFDLIFSEGSFYGVEDDRDLAGAMAEAGNVFIPIFLSRKISEIEEVPLHLLEKFSLDAEEILPGALFPMKSVSCPLEILLGSAYGVGNVRFLPDKDGIYRRMPLFFTYKNMVLPSLPLAVAEFGKDKQKFTSIPFDKSGQMIIRYHGPSGTYRSYSAAAIINSFALMEAGKPPQIPPDEFSGKIVLVGTSAPGILDLRPTPFSSVSSGVEINATVIDNLLNKDFVRLTPAVIFIFLLGFFPFLTAFGTSILKKTWHIVLFSLVCVVLPFGAVCIAFFFGFWLDFVAPEFAVLLSFTAAALLNYSFEGRRRRFIKSVFRHYLSSHVIERVIKDPSLLQLGGEKREITSFFSDVSGFTSIAENLSPEELVNLLNAYLSEMTDIILSLGGTLDKYEGDAIIAFWNAPLDQPDHAVKACFAALRCQKRLKMLRSNFLERFGHELYMRIGLNSGSAVVGNMGSHNRFDYTAMGDTVNLASRLEGACKQYKVPILVGEATFEKVKDIIVSKEVDIVRVVGKTKPVRVFEIIGEKKEISTEEIDKIKSFHQALHSYRNRQWKEALDLFRKLEDDKLAEMYVSRVEHLMKFPPSGDWAGVYDLKHK